MQGDRNMGRFSITNLKPFVEIDSAQPAQNNEVINFGYFHTQREELKILINKGASAALKEKNHDPMQRAINTKHPLPSNSQYAATNILVIKRSQIIISPYQCID